MPAGRPSDYDPEIAADSCLRLSICTKSLVSILSERDEFPEHSTFYRWMLNHEELRTLYAHARDAQLQILADEIQEIADEPQSGEVVTIKGDEREVKISDMLEHRKLRIDARKWLLSKLAPKKYGDKTAITGDGGGPLQIITSIPRPPQ